MIGFHLDRDAGDPEIAADCHLVVQRVTVLPHWDELASITSMLFTKGRRRRRSDSCLIYEGVESVHFAALQFLVWSELLLAALFLHFSSTFSSGFPRPRTISCGLDHCLFCAYIESSDPLNKGMLKRYLKLYLVINVGVNGSSHEHPGSAGFQGFAGKRGRGGSEKASAEALSGRSECCLIHDLALSLQCDEAQEPVGPKSLPCLQAASTFSSGFPRPRTISCGLDHFFFRAGIESSDPLKHWMTTNS